MLGANRVRGAEYGVSERTLTSGVCLVAGLIGMAATATSAHAQVALGHGPSAPLIDDEPLFTVAAGPLLSLPSADHSFQNSSGIGVFVNGTVRIGSRFSFIVRYATATEPKVAAVDAVERRDALFDAGIHYFIPTPTPIRITAALMAGQHFSTPTDGSKDENGFGLHAEVGSSYTLVPNIAAVATVGYSTAWTSRSSNGRTVDTSFDVVDFSIGAQARF
jgi:hypothetical protein